MKVHLAWRDLAHSPHRFILTVMGVGAIIIATMGINGLYRGIVFEALLLINDIGADLWVVQGGRAGPFAETSYVPDGIDRRLEGIAGVHQARRFTYYNKQFMISGVRKGVGVTGIDFPRDNGSWIPLIQGRYLETNHYEAIADSSIGVVVGDVLRLGRDDYTVVGITKGQVDIGGDGLLFVSIADAQSIDVYGPSEAVLLNRASGRNPDRVLGSRVGAVILQLNPGADIADVRQAIQSWGDVSVMTRHEEADILLNGRLWRLRIQILAFVTTMFVVAGVVISLTIYTMTLEKLHSIAILKLIGARDAVIFGMICQIALMLGLFAFIFAIVIANLIYPYFPRRILLLWDDLLIFFVVMQIVCALASLAGIIRAKAVRAQDVLA